MKLNLFDVVMRPIKTSRKLLRLMKEIELEPVFKPNKNADRHKDTSEFLVLTSTVMMPVALYNMIAPSLVAVETEGYNPMSFKRRKNQILNIYEVSYASAVAMLVAERMEEANGKNS